VNRPLKPPIAQAFDRDRPQSPQGREVLLRLARRADALIEGFRPGVLDRLGLGWKRCTP